MLLERVIVALVVSVDSVVLGLVASERKTVGVLLLSLSPLFHVVFCWFGFLMQRASSGFVPNALLALAVLTILMGGGCLVRTYKPRLEAAQRPRRTQETAGWPIAVLALFCSVDALMAGFVYGYWEMALEEATVYMGMVNLAVVFCAVVVGKVLGTGETQSQERNQT